MWMLGGFADGLQIVPGFPLDRCATPVATSLTLYKPAEIQPVNVRKFDSDPILFLTQKEH